MDESGMIPDRATPSVDPTNVGVHFRASGVDTSVRTSAGGMLANQSRKGKRIVPRQAQRLDRAIKRARPEIPIAGPSGLGTSFG